MNQARREFAARLIGGLAELGHDVDSVPQEALSGQPDTMVWDASQEAGGSLITQDLDSLMCGGLHPKRIRRFCSSGCLIRRARD